MILNLDPQKLVYRGRKRKVRRESVEKVKRIVQSGANYEPLVVNERFEFREGFARYHALKELGLSITCIVRH